ncbi:hypothetical protein CBFG_02520 [Clostridiales bacterium 1_7_47FAA]|nr:hypothetical protein CBFG_02520 [Clostridiales bacterium 1_7_47FAA]
MGAAKGDSGDIISGSGNDGNRTGVYVLTRGSCFLWLNIWYWIMGECGNVGMRWGMSGEVNKYINQSIR